MGCEYPTQSKIVKNKITEKWAKKTKEEKDEITNRRKETNKKVYGFDSPMKSKVVKDKSIKTCEEKYRCEYVFQSEQIKEKIKEKVLEKYSCEFIAQNDEIKSKVFKTNRNNRYAIFIKQCKNKSLSPLFSKNDFINAKKGSVLKFKCECCGKEFDYCLQKHNSTVAIQYIKCPNHNDTFSSQYEQEIFDWLSSLGVTNIERNKRDWNIEGKNFEADLYLPDYNLAIEFNGIYWHSNLFKENDYHYNKWKFFKEIGIDCIQIFENEWWNKKDIIKSIILDRLNKSQNVIDSNDCMVKELSDDEYKLFIENNYIEEYKPAEIKLGLYYDNELVECLGLSKDEKYDWKIISDCLKNGFYIKNDLSVMIEYFKSFYNGNIVIYNNSRYHNNHRYYLNNFKYINHSKPMCYYFKINKEINLHNENEFQNVIDCYDETLTTKDNATINNYIWIYDCGYEILILNLKENENV